ncbi:hypothetical protein Poli38472_003224 [Pythium oligandrum]|uniref:Feruloyl esterase n=1 Tax=Pythium oligandrum TaxID=41045 RepID=A0A8K1FDV1_PYTOL|nr:hypothetical protein Poli38472_003224 [Pythium oligandrum]|eukprot:TMW57299.1 hypothetical protein Poli38472_003224 [Pythium oligandrum]
MPPKISLLCGLVVAVLGLLTTSVSATGRIVFSPGCFNVLSKPIASGTYTININGTDRQYVVRVPSDYRRMYPNRVILALHWYGGSIADVEGSSNKYGNGSYYGLQDLAKAKRQEDSTIFVAPQGLTSGPYGSGWYNVNDDDMTFIDAILQTIDYGLCIDMNQRFAVGFSFGGSMAYALAHTHATTFRAVAILSGTIFTPFTPEDTPVSVLFSHGVSDPGNKITTAHQMRDTFLEKDGCEAVPENEPAPGSGTHIKTEYKRCKSGRAVTFIAFDGVHIFSPVDVGDSKSWVPEEIWNFFMAAPVPCSS